MQTVIVVIHLMVVATMIGVVLLAEVGGRGPRHRIKRRVSIEQRHIQRADPHDRHPGLCLLHDQPAPVDSRGLGPETEINHPGRADPAGSGDASTSARRQCSRHVTPVPAAAAGYSGSRSATRTSGPRIPVRGTQGTRRDMTPKSGNRFSEKVTLHKKARSGMAIGIYPALGMQKANVVRKFRIRETG